MKNIIKEKISEIISNIVDQKLKENNSLSDAIQNNLEKCLMKRINHWVFYFKKIRKVSYQYYYFFRKENLYIMIRELFHANSEYKNETMGETKTEIINLLSSKGFTISETESIFEYILFELTHKMKINNKNLQ